MPEIDPKAEKKLLNDLKKAKEEAKKQIKKGNLAEGMHVYESALDIAKKIGNSAEITEISAEIENTDLIIYHAKINDTFRSAQFDEMTSKFSETLPKFEIILQTAEDIAKKGYKLGGSDTLYPIVQAVFIKFITMFEAIFTTTEFQERNFRFRAWKSYIDLYFCSLLPFFKAKMTGPENTPKMTSYQVQIISGSEIWSVILYHIEDVEGPKCLFVLNSEQNPAGKTNKENRKVFYNWIMEKIKGADPSLAKINWNLAYMQKSVEILPKEPFFRIGDQYLQFIRLFREGKLENIFHGWEKYSQFFPEPPFSKNIIKLSADQRKITLLHPTKKVSFTIDYDRGILKAIATNKNSSYSHTDGRFADQITMILSDLEPEIKRPNIQ